MPHENFLKIEEKQEGAILREVNAVRDGSGFDPATTTVLAQSLAFFPGWRLLDIGDHTAMPAKRCFVLHRPGRAIILDGTNASIYDLAREAPIVLDTDKAVAYARFFFAQVTGRHGRFLVAETVDDIPWLGDPPAPLRKEVGRRVIPLIAERAGTGYRLAATMLAGTALVAAEIEIAADGMVSIGRRDVLIEDLGVRDAVLDS